MKGHQTRYLPLAQLQVWHEYFRGGRARQLAFTPAADTQRALQRYGMVVRAREDGLDVLVPEAGLDALWSELQSGRAPRQLCWQLRSRDPLFALYTEARPPQQLLLPLLEGSGSADAAAWRAGLGARIDLHIKARRSTWKYLLLGDWQAQRPALLDTQGGVEFAAAAEAELLPDGRRAQVFRSRRRLALVEQGEAQQYCFEVRDLGTSPARLLMARLPLAAPRGLFIEQRLGRTRPVSEIFVNR